MILLYILLGLVAISLLIAYICFRMAFYVPKKIIIGPNDYPIPEGKIYEPYREQMVAWMKEIRAIPCRELTTTSYDGLTLYGKYYECIPNAPTEIIPMAASPLTFALRPSRKSRIAQRTVKGKTMTVRSVTCRTAATAVAPNATCERPSPR